MTSDPGDDAVSEAPGEGASEDAEAARQAARHAIVHAAEARMLRSLPRRINVGSFAAEHGLSPPELEQIFEEVRGASSYRAFLIRRLERVEQLALEACIPLKIASARGGFGHFGVFRRAFLSTFGREPADPFGLKLPRGRRRRVAPGTAAS